jgi:membrane protein
MGNKPSKLNRLRADAQALLDEKAVPTAKTGRWRGFAHFWVVVWRSFTRNRCPVRASALAYASLLALIPLLAVVMSITSTFLKSKESEDQIEHVIDKFVASVSGADSGSSSPAEAAPTSADQSTQNISALPKDEKIAVTQKNLAHNIHQFIQNTRSGALGVTGSVLLIFAAISMLSRIEATFNDIWGVPRGRSWFMRIVLYWGVLSLGPLLLMVALGLTSSSQLRTTKHLLATLPFIGDFAIRFGFQLLPILVLCLTFAAFYMLMPNTKVDWRAAFMGGLAAGLLFQLNNMVSVLYVSRVVSNSKIYGSLALVPVFMIGLYLSWIILLFGAQVAYTYQNRKTYLEEKQIESVSQRGREFIALRLMTLVGQRYLHGEPPCTVLEAAELLGVPTRLVLQIMQTLSGSRLVVETAGADTAYLPARPMETITCHDILLALRAGQGPDLATREGPMRSEVYGEFQRIQEAERQAASSVSVLALASRVQPQPQLVETTQPAAGL